MAPSATTSSSGKTLSFTDNFVNTINGKAAPTKSTRHGINPATAKPNPEVPVATTDDVDKAVDAAKVAFKTWSKTPVKERQAAVTAYANALNEYKQEFAELLTREQGKPVSFHSFLFWH
jgi:acyl-CoA reductase-like NAD-dependent aldehyde dehydrogenase